jgi:hypothetical protein
VTSETTSTSGRRSFANTTISAEMYCPACDRSFSELEKLCPDDGTALVRLTGQIDSLEGRTLDGRFTLLRRLGRGGMGAVYRARQLSIGRNVAVKVIKPELGADLQAARRFLREARLASRLTSPHSVSVLEFGQSSDGLLYLVMELLQGRTLARVLAEDGAMPPTRVARIGVQLCDALQAAHDHHIVHRDLKPANIVMLDEPSDRDFVKVLDFGLAKSLAGDMTTTQSGQLMGTPTYIAPETVIDGTVDPRSDLYALGVILFELCQGTPPFTGDNINSLLLQHAYTEPPPLGDHVPEALASVIRRLLDKEMKARFATAAEARAALEAFLADPSAAGAQAPPALPSQPQAQLPTQLIERSLRKTGISWGKLALALAAAPIAVLAAMTVLGDKRGQASETAIATEEASQPAGEAEPALELQHDRALPSEEVAAQGDDRAQPPGDPEAPTVELTLRASPRAQVFVDGSPRGLTPLEIQLPSSQEPVAVEFRRRGHRTVTRRVRPDQSHSLEVVLPTIARPPASRPARPERRAPEPARQPANNLPF